MNSADFYLQFENKFRGSSEEIHKRLEAYDFLLTKISTSSSAIKALDIGCGRGEWLCKCSDFGFDCSGIEINPSMADLCTKRGFQIYNDDALNVLSSLPEREFNIVSLFHVIEHITNKEIENIFRECHRILSPNGVLILETPSIDNLTVSSRQFYLDHTHINPINPDRLIFLLEYLGFDSAKYFFINPGQFAHDHPLSLKKVIAGTGQDLCILASNSKIITKQIFKEEQNIINKKYLSLTTINAALDFDLQTQKLLKQIDLLELSNDYLKKQIKFLLYRQDKLFNSFPFKIIRKLKAYILSSFIIFKTIVKKIIRRLNSILSLFNVVKYYFVFSIGIARKIVHNIISRLLGKQVANYLTNIMKRIFKKRSLITYNLKTNISKDSFYTRYLASNYKNSRRSHEIYRQISKNY